MPQFVCFFVYRCLNRILGTIFVCRSMFIILFAGSILAKSRPAALLLPFVFIHHSSGLCFDIEIFV